MHFDRDRNSTLSLASELRLFPVPQKTQPRAPRSIHGSSGASSFRIQYGFNMDRKMSLTRRGTSIGESSAIKEDFVFIEAI